MTLSSEAFDALRARIPNAKPNEIAGALRPGSITM
ncbi:hypothetical protein FHR20_001589 [Sphingomonas leidyi]|uniref:Uncharacterized protein n=1 Tax=Sphingomonas leidyi TaxID=68569 RepID=A0A7X5UYP9_9SPHN|nr:hypothetical protein [Sphingomonas leidyi]